MIKYRGYEIYYDPPPIPVRDHDYRFYHLDYDGPEDRRCGTGPNAADCKTQIDEMEETL
jgi:hypothetical protein